MGLHSQSFSKLLQGYQGFELGMLGSSVPVTAAICVPKLALQQGATSQAARKPIVKLTGGSASYRNLLTVLVTLSAQRIVTAVHTHPKEAQRGPLHRRRNPDPS